MAQSVNIKVNLTGAQQAQRALKTVSTRLKSLQGGIFNLRSAFVGLGAAFAIGGIIKATIRQEQALKQLEARLKSTKSAAGLTSKELTNLASGLQEVTTFGDEAVIETEALLLTFTKIGRDVFPDALRSVLDMSVAMGQDLKSSAIQLGKALNDPVGQMSALSRVGIVLSETQKQQVKDFAAVGDIASAQKVILEELQTEFGGAAEAARDTLGGALASLGNAFGDLLEMDALTGTRVEIERLIDDLKTPEVQAFADQIGKTLAGAMRTAAEAAGFLAKNMDLVVIAGAAFIGLKLGAAFGSLGAAFGPLGAAFGPLGALIGLATGALIGWVSTSGEAVTQVDLLVDELDDAENAFDRLKKIREQNEAIQRGEIVLNREETQSIRERTRAILEEENARLQAQLNTVIEKSEEARKALAETGVNVSGLAAHMAELNNATEEVITPMVAWQKLIDANNEALQELTTQGLNETHDALVVALLPLKNMAKGLEDVGDAAGEAKEPVAELEEEFVKITRQISGFIAETIAAERALERSAFFGEGGFRQNVGVDSSGGGGRADVAAKEEIRRNQEKNNEIIKSDAERFAEAGRLGLEALRDEIDRVNREKEARNEAAQAALDRLTDIEFHTIDVMERMHSATTQFFKGMFTGATSLRDGLKSLFTNIADSILSEFARIASSFVFQVLFGSGGAGGAGANIGRQAGSQLLSQRGGSLFGGGGGGGFIGDLLGGILGGGAIDERGALGRLFNLGSTAGALGSVFTGGTIISSAGTISAAAGPLGFGTAAGGAGPGLGALAGPIGIAAAALPLLFSNFDLGGIFSDIFGGIADIGSSIIGGIGSFFGGIGDFFGGLFQQGGDTVVTRPTLLGVGEVGPERISIRPLAGRQGGGSGGTTVVVQGPLIVDEIGMSRFTSGVADGVSRAQSRVL